MRHEASFFSAVIDTLWLAALYYGLVHGVDGALNVGLFLAWLMFALSFGVFIPEAGEEIGEAPVWAIARSVVFDIVAVALLAWHGWMITAAAVAWTTIIGFGAWSSSRKEEAES